ncbi:MAG: enoyl-CoA hydratase/isomerase family protein [Nocardioidaceae bacterium]
MPDLEFEVADGVGTVTLNRPDRRNAFTLAMIDRCHDVFCDSRRDESVRAVVVRGAGGAFCSGVDLDELESQPQTPLEHKSLLTDRVHRLAYALDDFDKPVIAAVDGVAVGAGMDISLMCDIRLASRTARFSQGYVRVGLVPGDGGCYLLPRLVGMARALELMWTGDFVGAEEAERIGLVSHVHEQPELDAAAHDLARRLADGPGVAISMIKRAAYQCARTDLRTALDLISSHQAVVQSTQDSTEAIRAFREKREPVFRGR